MRLKEKGFSLVEVVLALGIVAFAGISLLGLFSVGISTNRESIEELEATHLVQSLFAMRRASPLAILSDFPLPPLDQTNSASVSSPLFVTSDGQLLSNADGARFGMIYRVTPDEKSPGNTKIYLCLYWPATVPPDKAQGRYEIHSILSRP